MTTKNKNCTELYMTLQDYTGQYGTMKGYAGCMNIQLQYYLRLNVTRQVETELFRTINYHRGLNLNYIEPYRNIMYYTDVYRTK